MIDVDVVIPTIGRPSLQVLLDALLSGEGPLPRQVIVVDDRADRRTPVAPRIPEGVRVVSGPAAGPAAARNRGWRCGRSPWVAFLDDDVVPGPGWRSELLADLERLPADVAASTARIEVPLPADRRPTDWERNVAGLASALYITADMAYRREALEAVGGFDERFPRAYREDADLALRVRQAGWRIAQGRRRTVHPVRPADRWVSVRLQRGNADDVLLRWKHGRRWRELAGIGPGRRSRHLAVTAAALVAVGAGLRRRPRPAALGALAWAAGTAEFAWSRVAPGPRTRDEIVTMAATSALIPPVASWHWLAGWVTLARRLTSPPALRPAAVLLDRDGTLVVDVPYNGDPERVVPMPGARSALERLRAAGVPTAVVSNQSGVARGLLTPDQVDAVNRRVEDLLGPLGPWAVCPHGPDDGCGCRKPAAGLVRQAADALGVDPRDCVVIGDIGADVEAARAAGARAVLVPTAVTRPEEVAAAPVVAPTLEAAVDLVLGAAP